MAELAAQVRETVAAVPLIRHDMPWVDALCDRTIVLHHGRVIANLRKADTTIEDIVTWITAAALK